MSAKKLLGEGLARRHEDTKGVGLLINFSGFVQGYFPNGKLAFTSEQEAVLENVAKSIDGGAQMIMADRRAKPGSWPPKSFLRIAIARKMMRVVAVERWRAEHGLHVEGINDGGRDIAVAMVLEATRFEKAIGRCRYALNS